MFKAKNFNKQNVDCLKLFFFFNDEIFMFNEHFLSLNINQRSSESLLKFMIFIFSFTVLTILFAVNIIHLIQFSDIIFMNF